MSDRACVVRIAPELLAELLQLPRGAYIDYVHAPADEPGVLQMRIRGCGPEVALGAKLSHVFPIARRTPAAANELVTRIEWDGA